MKVDMVLLYDIIIILFIGLLMVLSSLGGFIMFSDNFIDGSFMFIKQIVIAIIGLLIMIGLSKVDYSHFKKYSKIFYIISVLLLILVLIVGKGKGVRRWLMLGPISFQPSELAKYSLVIFLAAIYDSKKDMIDNLNIRLLYFYLPIAITIGLIILEPNFGTAFVIGFISITILFIMGFDVKELGIIVLLAMIVLSIGIMVKPYARMRIIGFFNPKGTNIPTAQSQYSLFAIGSGKLFGLGLGNGMTKLFFLPRAYTDFIFSVIGEELGFIGSIVLVVAYFVMIIRGLKIARRATDYFCCYASYGIVIIISYYIIFNILIALKLFPITGLPLPLVSVGGSSLIITLIAMGILLSISRNNSGVNLNENGFDSVRRNRRSYISWNPLGK
jgi:cell division protein FtsW